jgi:hypothetical protein
VPPLDDCGDLDAVSPGSECRGRLGLLGLEGGRESRGKNEGSATLGIWGACRNTYAGLGGAVHAVHAVSTQEHEFNRMPGEHTRWQRTFFASRKPNTHSPLFGVSLETSNPRLRPPFLKRRVQGQS